MVPLVLLALVYYLFQNQPGVFDRVGLIMLGLSPCILMFIITSVAMLRERTSGTLERLLTTPLHKADLLFGYGLAFALLAAVQALASSGLAYWVFDLRTAGSVALVIVIAVCDSLLGMALGLFFSVFARSEFQAVQFMPAATSLVPYAACSRRARKWPDGCRASRTSCRSPTPCRACKKSAPNPRPAGFFGATCDSGRRRPAGAGTGRGDVAPPHRLKWRNGEVWMAGARCRPDSAPQPSEEPATPSPSNTRQEELMIENLEELARDDCARRSFGLGSSMNTWPLSPTTQTG